MPLLLSSRLCAGSLPASAPSSSSLRRSQNARKLSSPSRCSSQPSDEPADACRRAPRSGRGGRAAGRSPRRARARRGGDVVGLAAHALLVAHGRALEADVADPVLGAGVRAAVEVEPQLGDASPNRASRCSTSAASRVFVSVTEKLQCGSPVQRDRAGADRVDRRAGSRAPRAARRRRSTSPAGTPVRTKFCCRVMRTSRPLRRRARRARSSASPLTSPTWTGTPTRRSPSCFCGPTPMWSVDGGGAGAARSPGSAAEPLLDLGAHALGPDVVDHELEPRLDARDAVAEVLLPGVDDRAQDRQRLLVADEDAQVAREPRHGREPAADQHGEARAAVVDRADERDAVDLGALQRCAQAEIVILCFRGRSR